MPADIHLMGKGKMMDKVTRIRVLELTQDVLSKIEDIHPIKELDIVLFPSFNLHHSEYFYSGICHSANAIEICFNPNHHNFDNRFEKIFPTLLIHETHHALRYRHFNKWTIGENLMLEGLARSAETRFGDTPVGVGPDLPKDTLAELCLKAAKEKDFTEFDKFYWIWERHSDEHHANMYHVGKWFIDLALNSMNEDAFGAISCSYQDLMAAGCQQLKAAS